MSNNPLYRNNEEFRGSLRSTWYSPASPALGDTRATHFSPNKVILKPMASRDRFDSFIDHPIKVSPPIMAERNSGIRQNEDSLLFQDSG